MLFAVAGQPYLTDSCSSNSGTLHDLGDIYSEFGDSMCEFRDTSSGKKKVSAHEPECLLSCAKAPHSGRPPWRVRWGVTLMRHVQWPIISNFSRCTKRALRC